MTSETSPPKKDRPAIDLRRWQSRRIFLTVILGMAVALVCVYAIDPSHPILASVIVGGATLLAWFVTGLIFRPPQR